MGLRWPEGGPLRARSSRRRTASERDGLSLCAAAHLSTSCLSATGSRIGIPGSPESRISSEIPTFDAIFSMAASVHFKALAIVGSGCFLAASDRSFCKSSLVQRTAAPSGTPRTEAFLFVESRLRLSLRAIIAAVSLCFARALNSRTSSLLQRRCLEGFFFAITESIPNRDYR